jgi:hypothetical protein
MNRTRRARLLRATALLVMAAVIFGSESTAGAFGRTIGTFNGCPHGLQALPLTWRHEAATEAMTFLTTTYAAWNRQRHWALRMAGAQGGAPFLVRRWLPSGWIKRECGRTVWARSVGVTFIFPAMEYPNPKGPCNACAHVTLLLGKTRSAWVSWGNY